MDRYKNFSENFLVCQNRSKSVFSHRFREFEGRKEGRKICLTIGLLIAYNDVRFTAFEL